MKFLHLLANLHHPTTTLAISLMEQIKMETGLQNSSSAFKIPSAALEGSGNQHYLRLLHTISLSQRKFITLTWSSALAVRCSTSAQPIASAMTLGVIPAPPTSRRFCWAAPAVLHGGVLTWPCERSAYRPHMARTSLPFSRLACGIVGIGDTWSLQEL